MFGKHVKKISIALVIVILVSVFAPASYVEAAKEVYLAYQTIDGEIQVKELEYEWEKEAYKVEKLIMSPGDKIDLCIINAKGDEKAKWTSSDDSVVAIDSKGVVTAKKAGVSEITVTYKKATVKIKAHVGDETWGVAVGTHEMSTDIKCYQLKKGTDINLNVYGIPEFDRTDYWMSYKVDWTSSDKKIVEMIGNTLHARKAGTAEVTAKITNRVTGKVIEKRILVKVTNPVKDLPDDWDNEYYRMYGENYKRLFSSTKLLLAGANEVEMLDEAYRVHGCEIKTVGISGLLELVDVSNGLEIAFDAIFNGKDSMSEKLRLEAIQYLIDEMTDDSISEKYVQNVADGLEKAKSIFDSMNDVSDFDEAVKKIEEADLVLEKAEVDSIVNYFKNDAVGDIGKIVSEGVTYSEYLISTICLYEADDAFLDELQKCSVPGEALYDDIELLKEKRKKDPEKYFKKKYVSDLAGRAISKVLVNAVEKNTIAFWDAAEEVISMIADMEGVSSLSEVSKASYLMNYISGVSDRMSAVRIEIKENFDGYTNEQLIAKIEQYELLYNTFLAMVKPVCMATYDLEKEWNQELLDDSSIPSRGYDYGRHIAEAMNLYLNENNSVSEEEVVKEIGVSVQDKLDELLNKLGTKEGKTVYFTANQKACGTKRASGHGCANCNVGDIIQTTWFKNTFGTITTSLFPSHDVNGNRRDSAGQSCFGFACFAQWYLYAEDSTDKVEAERVAVTTYSKENLQANVKPGDVLRVNGHSVLVYEVGETGLSVIDSNYNVGGQLNCVVQKHIIPYTHSQFKGEVVYVNRVKDTESIKLDESLKEQIGYLDLEPFGWSAYNVGLDVEMNADKKYTIYQNSKLKILGEYTNSKKNKIYRVYSESLGMECYVAAKYVVLGELSETSPKVTNTPTPTLIMGYLDLEPFGWSAYNVGLDVEMNADKAYTIYQNSKLKILGEYTNSKKNKIYRVYSESLGMECYVAAKCVVLGEAPKATVTNTPKPTATNTPRPTATSTPKPTNTPTPSPAPTIINFPDNAQELTSEPVIFTLPENDSQEVVLVQVPKDSSAIEVNIFNETGKFDAYVSYYVGYYQDSGEVVSIGNVGISLYASDAINKNSTVSFLAENAGQYGIFIHNSVYYNPYYYSGTNVNELNISCRIIPPDENEPNGTIETATLITEDKFTFFNLLGQADTDYFMLTLTEEYEKLEVSIGSETGRFDASLVYNVVKYNEETDSMDSIGAVWGMYASNAIRSNHKKVFNISGKGTYYIKVTNASNANSLYYSGDNESYLYIKCKGICEGVLPTATNTPKPTATNTPRPTATSTPKQTNTPTPFLIAGDGVRVELKLASDCFTYDTKNSEYVCTGLSEKGYVEFKKYGKEHLVLIQLPDKSDSGKKVKGFYSNSSGGYDLKDMLTADSAYVGLVCPETYTVYYGVCDEMPDSKYVEKLSGVVLNDGIEEIENSAFYGCTGLKSVRIPETVESIGYNAFFGCTDLKEIVIPDSVKTFADGVFSGCENLVIEEFSMGGKTFALDVFNGVTIQKLKLDGEVNLFYDRWGYPLMGAIVETVEIAEDLKKISARTFGHCNGIEELEIPDGIEEIGDRAFYWCTELEEIKLPASLEVIGKDAFYNCGKLSIITPSGSYAETYAIKKGIKVQNQ